MPKQSKERLEGMLHLKSKPHEGAAGQSIPEFPELQIKTFTIQEMLVVYENAYANRPHCQQSCALFLNLQSCMLIEFFCISVSITIVDLWQ